MILLTSRHGLRASEVCGLQWSDVEFETGSLHLRKAKGGSTSTHPLLGDELRVLRAGFTNLAKAYLRLAEQADRNALVDLVYEPPPSLAMQT